VKGREVVSLRNLWAGYGGVPVLEDVTLSVEELDYVGLIGPNGGGKTTLLRVVLGLLEPMQGEVSVMGTSAREGRWHVGYVPQSVEFDRDFPVKVWDVVRMGRLRHRRLLRSYTAGDDAIVECALRDVAMLDQSDRPIGTLSGGQRQRVYIARALATEPRILVLDEPMAGVDPQVSASVYELLGQLNERVTILMVTHDMGVISSHVKTVGCLNRRLFYHGEKQITADMLEAAYQCPIDLIAHGVSHRVFAEHDVGEAH
jgi:zinc transport system ATP-binding protein